MDITHRGRQILGWGYTTLEHILCYATRCAEEGGAYGKRIY